jgi:hypothetical protein
MNLFFSVSEWLLWMALHLVITAIEKEHVFFYLCYFYGMCFIWIWIV